MGLGAKRLLLNLLAGIAVVTTVAVIGIGLPAINDAIPAARPAPAGRYSVGAGVSIVPPPGAGLDATKTRPGPLNGTALFVLGSVRYAVVVTPFDGTLAQAAERLQAKISANAGYQVIGGKRPIRTTSGVLGQEGAYSSPGRDGRYAVFLANGLDAEVTVAGNGVELHDVMPVVQASIMTLSFGKEPQ
jgi:hypothetical protein